MVDKVSDNGNEVLRGGAYLDSERKKYKHLVEITNKSTSAYGDSLTVMNQSTITSHPVYNFFPANFRSFSALSGSADVSDGVFKCSTGTTQFGYGAIQSFRSISYRAGSGGEIRFGAIFPTATAGTQSGCGAISIGNEVTFGTSGDLTVTLVWYEDI